MRLTGQRRPAWVAKGLDMGKRRLLKGMRCMVLSSLTFTCNNSVRYFNHTWLSKATDIVAGEKGNLSLERDLRKQVSSLILAMARET